MFITFVRGLFVALVDELLCNFHKKQALGN